MTAATPTRTAKRKRFILAKEQLCTCMTLFCTFLNHCCTTVTWNCLISRSPLSEVNTATQQFPFSFSKLRYGPFRFNPSKFHQHLTNIEIKWKWIRSMKTVRTLLLLSRAQNSISTLASHIDIYGSFLTAQNIENINLVYCKSQLRQKNISLYLQT